MFKITTDKGRIFTVDSEEKLVMLAVYKCQENKMFSDYVCSNHNLERTIDVLGNFGLAVEEIDYIDEDEYLDSEDEEGDYERDIYFAEMSANALLSY